MAAAPQQSLLEKLQQGRSSGRLVNIGGVLQEVAGEEIQSLAGQQGIAVPTTPLAAAAIGAAPDQAKMVGDARQKAAALRVGLEGPASLATTQRVEQARTDRTEAERRAATSAQTLASLGGLGERVQTLVTGEIQKLGTAAATAAPTFTAAEEIPETARGALEAWGADRGNVQKTLAAAMALGLDPADPALASKLTGALTETTDVAGLVARGIIDPAEITFGSVATQLGYDTPEKVSEVEAALGLQPGQVTALSIADLQAAVERVHLQEFQEVQAALAAASNPSLSPAERLAAQKQLRDLGAAGVRATEEDIVNLATAVEEAEEVEFAGKIYTIEELLSDENISGMVAHYMESDEATKKEMEEQGFAPLADFIKKNEAVIADAVTELGAEANQFAEIQQANQAVANTAQTLGVPADIVIALFPGATTLQAEKLSVPPVMQWATSEDPQYQPARENLQALSAAGMTDLAKELAGMTEDQLKNTGILERGGKWDSFISFKKNRARLETLDPASPDFQNVLAEMFFGNARDLRVGTGKVDLRRRLVKNKQYSALGYGDDSIQQLLDGDGDGQIDDPTSLKSRLISMTGDSSLGDLAAGKRVPGLPDFTRTGTAPGLPNDVKSVIDNNQGLFADGNFERSEMDRLSIRDLLKLNQVRGNLPSDKSRELKAAIETKQNRNFQNMASFIRLKDPGRPISASEASIFSQNAKEAADGLARKIAAGEASDFAWKESDVRTLLQKLQDTASNYKLLSEAAAASPSGVASSGDTSIRRTGITTDVGGLYRAAGGSTMSQITGGKI